VNHFATPDFWYCYRHWLWLARFACGGLFGWLMVYEWNCWPNGTALLGPLGIIWYNGFRDQILVFCVVSLVALFAFLLKPNKLTAVISVIGLVNWLFWGVMALGIGC
jgi:hypothetical protein